MVVAYELKVVDVKENGYEAFNRALTGLWSGMVMAKVTL